ncbi:type I polyketide synthase [Corallococcus terminator]|uniref:Polyketide synthase n=1 Tax=Corallococcus terminator TaxID=2316733 RepID=A0A3A8I4I2_9BACT|nr:type I polyketide synthase [Corallococcus terminator]RKG78387.1 polyketide synthase [Corallococcus terminator]
MKPTSVPPAPDLSDDADAQGHGVAIIGMACRFPGARTPAEFWDNLARGVESITRFTPEQLREAGESAELLKHPRYVPAAPILDDIDQFDAGFFRFSPAEARVLDPQQRFFMEVSWEALEHAGYVPESFPGTIGVYAGSSTSQYASLIRPGSAEAANPFALFGNDKDYLTTQLSYRLDLRGPSLGIQTACSTSLVAVHLACQSLLGGECDLALAGAVSISVPHLRGYVHEEGSSVSPEGSCRAFDAKANGTPFGSGLGVVILKRLSEAIEDGDTIHAIIKGSALNNDGALKVGFAAPGGDSQARVIREALVVADCEPASISYVEANGTGTPLGDTIEVSALNRAFGLPATARDTCALGSVKTNIGHLSVASGMAGLIKTVLALEHQQVPASLNFDSPNPRLDFAQGPFFINTALKDWPAPQGPRRAGVSAFGIGGTNAHLILEEAPPPTESAPARSQQLLLLSARSAQALDAAASRLATHLEQHPGLPLEGVAHTLHRGRRHFDHRRAVVCGDSREASQALRRTVTVTRVPPEPPQVHWLLHGGGMAALELGRALYPVEARFREAVDRCASIVGRLLGRDARTPFLGTSKAASVEPWFEHLAPGIVAYGLAQVWSAWGVRPASIVAYGSTEAVAASLAGIMSLEDALAWTCARNPALHGQPSERPPRLTPPTLPLRIGRQREWLTEETATLPGTWARPWGEPRPSEGDLRALLQERQGVILCLGPLADDVRLAAEPRLLAPSASTADRHAAEADLLGCAGRLYERGLMLDGQALYAQAAPRRLPLPTYPFERQRFWVESPPAPTATVPEAAVLPSVTSGTPVSLRFRSLAQIEHALTVLWKDLLGAEQVTPRSSFASLGGSSLRITELQRRLGATFEIEVPLAVLMRDPSLAELSVAVLYRCLGNSQQGLLAHLQELSDEDAEQLLHHGQGLERSPR